MSYTKNYLIQSQDYDVVQMNWEKGSKTKLHDHPEIGCHLLVLKGMLEETFFGDEVVKTILKPNDASFRKGQDKHIIEALEDTVSIHVYLPGNYKPNYFFNNI
jgi:hypothetical protein